MKKVLGVIAAAGCLAAASTALAGVGAGTGINGSLHDMTKVISANADNMGRVCVFCHTPHHATVTSPSGDNLPLWNHKLPDGNFTPYTWATPDNDATDAKSSIDVLAGPSRLCMSCHDGSIAVDEHGDAWAYGGGGKTSKISQIGLTHDGVGRANLTKDLSNTHPIGFNYLDIASFRNGKSLNGDRNKNGAQNGDTEIVSAGNGYATGITLVNTQGTYNTVTRAIGGKTIADNLYDSKIMTCATCHEVHNKENATQDPYTDGKSYDSGIRNDQGVMIKQSAPNYFLYAKQTQSLICLSCHIK